MYIIEYTKEAMHIARGDVGAVTLHLASRSSFPIPSQQHQYINPSWAVKKMSENFLFVGIFFL